MAYAIKYLFKFESSNGTTREIRVLQDGYSGDVIQRPLGRAPVLKKQQNGPVHGTSLEFYAECNVDREFIEFYTSDPKAYRVDLYAGATLLWQGYITPELYSEPDIAPPYDVQVVATDGVGELKLYNYAAQGTVTLRTLLSGLLSRTGLGTDIYLISSLKPGSAGAGSLLEKTINLDYLAGNSCYEVLTYILDTLHATITWWKGAWILARETNVTFTTGKVRYFNTAGNSALLNDSVQVLGKMYANPAWPVGQLSTVIDPAKNRVTVQAPWHVVTCLRNSDMGSDADWTKAKNARYETDGYVLPININTGTSETAVISQATSMAGLRVPMSLSVRATGATSEISAQVTGAVLGVLLTYKVGNVTYHLVKGDDGVPVWQQGSDIGTYIPLRTRIDFQQQLATWDSSRIEAEELTIDNIPPFLQGTTFPPGTLTVYILGYCAKIYGAYLDVVLPKGYQDVLRIDNGARGEGSEVEIAIGRETADNAYYAAFLQGLLLDSGNLITSFSDANFPGGMDYLAFIARDYALSVALPRAKVTGTVYLESGIAAPPLVFTKGALNYWLQTWSWNLYEDELEIEGLTLPSASLTVESETILESTASTSSSTGRTSGGGAPISPGTSMAAVQEWVNSQGYLASVEAASTYATITALNGVSGRVTTLEGRTNWDTYFGVDENGDIYVKKNGNTARNFYSWGAVSAGGLSSGGGSEGASLPAVWASLKTNSDDYANEKINAYHIPIGSGLSVVNGLIVANNAGTVTSVKVGTTTYNPTDGVVSLPAYPTTLPASDVYSWAKAETKPSYAFSEITGTASTSQIPTLAISKISGLQDALNGKQASDADLTAIAGLSGTSGFLKKTAANTWALDTNTYLTGITSSMVTTALGYTPANVTALGNYVLKSGDTMSGALSIRSDDTPLALYGGANSTRIDFRTSDNTWAGYVMYGWDRLYLTARCGSGQNGVLGISKSMTDPFWSPDNGTTYYNLYHSGNANITTVNWAANQMVANSFKLASGTPTLSWDANANAWHLSGNFYADGFISAGGVSSGGGASGVDLTAVWNNLIANTGEGLNKKIHTAHLPTVTITGTNISGTGTYSGTGGNTSTLTLNLTNSGVRSTTINGNYLRINTNGTNTDLTIPYAVKSTYITSPFAGYPDDVITDETTSDELFKASNGTLFPVFHENAAGVYSYSDTLYWSGYDKYGGTELVTQYNVASNVGVKIRKYSQTLNGWGAWTTFITDGNYTSYVNTTNFPGLNGNQTITLSGDVSGSGATSIAVSIGTGKVTNAMLAGSIENSKLNTIGVAKGGTGLTTWTGAYRIIYSSAATTVTTLAPNSTTTRKFLRQVGANNAATAPAWDTVTKTDVGLSNVENTALSTWAGTNKITTLGTITTGTWNGTAIANSYLANSAITINGSSTSLGGSFSTASITAGTAGQSTASSGVSFSVPYVTMNAYGIVTGYGTHTHTISAQNLYDTIGSTKYAPYNANGYLPLNGGTLTGNLSISTAQQPQIIFTENGTQIGGIYGNGTYGARIYASGNDSPQIGVKSGTAHPIFRYNGADQTVWHSGNSNLSTVDWACSNLTIGSPGSNGVIGCPYSASNTNKYNYIDFYASSSDGDIRYVAGAWTGNDHISHRFIVGSGGSVDALTIRNNGNIGIGTTSPAYKLDVNGTTASSYFKATQTGHVFLDSAGRYVISTDGDSYMIFGYGNMAANNTTYIDGNTIKFRCGTSYNNALTITSTGAVQITNTASQWPFYIGTDYNNTTSSLYAGLPNYGLYIGSSASTGTTYLLNICAGESGHGSGGTSRFYVRADGNVGVGTASPGAKLDVVGDFRTDHIWIGGDSLGTYVVARSTSGIRIQYNKSSSGSNYDILRMTNGSMTWTGNIVANGAITAGSASDARLKTNIQSLSAEAAKRIVMALNPVTFTWNEKATELYDQYKGDDLGMIAQEVEPYLPQAVGTIFENYKRLDYTKVISPLVKVAQDHESRIRQLEAENRELRKRLNMN